jgi:hypothetical protein
VVEEEEANRMKASGIWFDSPVKAAQYRKNVENEIKNEPKKKPSMTKLKEKSHER